MNQECEEKNEKKVIKASKRSHEVIKEEKNVPVEELLSDEETLADLEDNFSEENSLPIDNVLELHECIESVMHQNEVNAQ